MDEGVPEGRVRFTSAWRPVRRSPAQFDGRWSYSVSGGAERPAHILHGGSLRPFRVPRSPPGMLRPADVHRAPGTTHERRFAEHATNSEKAQTPPGKARWGVVDRVFAAGGAGGVWLKGDRPVVLRRHLRRDLPLPGCGADQRIQVHTPRSRPVSSVLLEARAGPVSLPRSPPGFCGTRVRVSTVQESCRERRQGGRLPFPCGPRGLRPSLRAR